MKISTIPALIFNPLPKLFNCTVVSMMKILTIFQLDFRSFPFPKNENHNFMRFYKHSVPNSYRLLNNLSNKSHSTNKSRQFLVQHFSRFSPEKMGPTALKVEESFKRLPLPNKGLCDKYEYSVIQLNNGLTALLISDVENLITLDATQTVEHIVDVESGDDSGDESANSGTESDDMDVDESGEKGEGKKKSDEKLAALSLTVGKFHRIKCRPMYFEKMHVQQIFKHVV